MMQCAAMKRPGCVKQKLGQHEPCGVSTAHVQATQAIVWLFDTSLYVLVSYNLKWTQSSERFPDQFSATTDTA